MRSTIKRKKETKMRIKVKKRNNRIGFEYPSGFRTFARTEDENGKRMMDEDTEKSLTKAMKQYAKAKEKWERRK